MARVDLSARLLTVSTAIIGAPERQHSMTGAAAPTFRGPTSHAGTAPVPQDRSSVEDGLTTAIRS